MKCGKGHDHATVADVRACYGVGGGTATATLDYRANKFAGVCVLCGAKVPEGEGRIDRRDGGGYNVSHLKGKCATNGTKTVLGPTSRDFAAVKGGYYATRSLTGNNDLDFWFVREGTRNTKLRFVKRVLGGRGTERVHSSTALAALQAILQEGVDVCGDRFAEELGRCRDCGLTLTDEVSRRERRGPICRAK